MNYRKLGKTDLNVSVIGFGCVELGIDYGIKMPGRYGKPDKETAKKILYKALDNGINLFDTAPSYGESENILGAIVGSQSCYIATKINIPNGQEDKSKSIRMSIERSLRNLRRDYLDIVQIHNATADTIRQYDIFDILLRLRKDGLIRFIGVSVYEPENALAAARAGCFDLLQIAYNILDHRMKEEVIPEVRKSRMGILSRSAYFKGVLTQKAEYLNGKCEFLRKAVNKIKTKMNIQNWNELAKYALRFCISTEGIDSILVGIGTIEELEFAVQAEREGGLAKSTFERLLKLGIEDKFWLNPSNWPKV